MRLEGKLVDWNDAKGFGFVQAGTDRERFLPTSTIRGRPESPSQRRQRVFRKGAG